MKLTYETSSILNRNNTLSYDDNVFNFEWEELQFYNNNINNNWNNLNSTKYNYSKSLISNLDEFNKQIDSFITINSASYDEYIGRFIIDGDENYKNKLSNKNNFEALKNIYKNWNLQGHKKPEDEQQKDLKNNFNDYVYSIEDNVDFQLNNDINFLYDCNISGSLSWDKIADEKLLKTSFDNIDSAGNFETKRWIWDITITTDVKLGTSDYYLPQEYPYDWAVNRHALLSWHNHNQTINKIVTSSIFIPGHLEAMEDGIRKSLHYTSGKYIYTYSSSSYNLMQDYTGSFTPNENYSKSKLIKYDLKNTYMYLNFGYAECVPIPIINDNIIIEPHEDNQFSTRIHEFQSSSFKYKSVQIISSHPSLIFDINVPEDMPYYMKINDNMGGEFISENKKDLNFEIKHNGKCYNTETMNFEDFEGYTENEDIIHKKLNISFRSRDWSLSKVRDEIVIDDKTL